MVVGALCLPPFIEQRRGSKCSNLTRPYPTLPDLTLLFLSIACTGQVSFDRFDPSFPSPHRGDPYPPRVKP